MPYVLSMLDCRHLNCTLLPAGCGLTLYFSHVFDPQVTPLAPKEAAARSLHNCKCGILAGSLTFLGEALTRESTSMLRLEVQCRSGTQHVSAAFFTSRKPGTMQLSPATAVTSLCCLMTEAKASGSRAYEASGNTLMGGAAKLLQHTASPCWPAPSQTRCPAALYPKANGHKMHVPSDAPMQAPSLPGGC